MVKEKRNSALKTTVVLIIGCFYFLTGAFMTAEDNKKDNGPIEISPEEIDSFVKKLMRKGRIPGAVIVIVRGSEEIYKKGFGYSDLKNKIPLTHETLFELGSNSKAFTALGIHQLVRGGAVTLNDPIKKYIPWFKTKFENVYTDITVGQALYHTSGIPFKSISFINPSQRDDALEQTVKSLIDVELDFQPGKKFSYATINYDILGLIIQYLSGMSFEDYMQEKVLIPLGLKQTFTSRKLTSGLEFSKGYKLGFLAPREFTAPVYRGNVPAGYFISNINDMGKWLRMQLNAYDTPGFDRSVIEDTHIPNRTVAPSVFGRTYASGWELVQDGGGEYLHGGSNPNFSSYLVFRPEENLGLAVLANMNSAFTSEIGIGIMKKLLNEPYAVNEGDIYRKFDNFSSTALFIVVPFNLVLIYLIGLSCVQVISKKRTLRKIRPIDLVRFFSALLMIGLIFFSVYHINEIFFQSLSWEFMLVWSPLTWIIAVSFTLASVALFFIYFVMLSAFPKHNENTLLNLIIMSLVAGFGHTLVILFVNETITYISRNSGGKVFNWYFLLYFVMSLMIYLVGQKIIRTRIIRFTNRIVFEKRLELINKIFKTSYDKFENIEGGRINACLNNDTERISNFAHIAVTGFTSLVSLVCCFTYLAILNLSAFSVAFVAIFLAMALYGFIGTISKKLWERTREIQNLFFGFINDLVCGFKELYLNFTKKQEFGSDIRETCEEYRKKRIKAEVNFADVFVAGELVFYFVVFITIFILPILFADLKVYTIRSYIMVFFYLTGAVHGVMNCIPEAIQIKISWNRINKICEDISVGQLASQERFSPISTNGRSVDIEVRNLIYSYKNENEDKFSIGPVNCGFKSGEITMVTGGNGSGKSTLAKLITGLYFPDEGEIIVNEQRADPQNLAQNYSAVFSDFHLFEKLYGIDYINKNKQIDEYLKIMQIEKKLTISDGSFSTTKLSSGQRKRLALLISYLEDRPVFMFDEWAADQDPQFKEFFYTDMLPQLRDRGKCVIAITHDDRFFHIADKIIKMDSGKVIDSPDVRTQDKSVLPA